MDARGPGSRPRRRRRVPDRAPAPTAAEPGRRTRQPVPFWVGARAGDARQCLERLGADAGNGQLVDRGAVAAAQLDQLAHSSLGEDGDAIAERFGIGQDVRGEDHRRAGGVAGADELAHGVAAGGIEAGHRLVEDQQLRAG